MATIDTSNPALAGISRYSKTLEGTENMGAKDLGQQDFLQLLTTQLQNQDPFAPMENGDFLAQMAQFSQLSGIEDINTTLKTLGEGMGQFRVATASSMLGQHVLVPGTLARPDEDGRVSGVVDLERAAQEVVVTYEDPMTGEIFETQTFKSQPSGLMGFDWDDVPQSVIDNKSGVRVNVAVLSNGERSIVGPSVFAKVMGVHMASADAGMNLEVQDYGVINSMEIEQIR